MVESVTDQTIYFQCNNLLPKLSVATFGIPKHAVSDNGLKFTNVEFKEFIHRNTICHTWTALGHLTINVLHMLVVSYLSAYIIWALYL